MELLESTKRALNRLAETLPDQSNIELCMSDSAGRRACHRFMVISGVVHHSGSHSDDTVISGTGPVK